MLEGDDPRGILPKQADRSPASALDGPVRLVPNSITPDFWAVNTMTPPYAPTYDLDPKRPGYADWSDAKTLVPQHHATIVDMLSQRGVDWAWYAGGWAVRSEERGVGKEGVRAVGCRLFPSQ